MIDAKHRFDEIYVLTLGHSASCHLRFQLRKCKKLNLSLLLALLLNSTGLPYHRHRQPLLLPPTFFRPAEYWCFEEELKDGGQLCFDYEIHLLQSPELRIRSITVSPQQIPWPRFIFFPFTGIASLLSTAFNSSSFPSDSSIISSVGNQG